jgi:hypothetical protein
VSSGTEIDVETMGNGISGGNTLDDVDSGPTKDIAESAKPDENELILEMERRDFNDEEGIEADVE